MTSVEGDQIVLSALLVCRANAPVGAPWKPQVLDVDGLIGRHHLGHIHHHHRLAAQFLDRDARSKRTIEHAGALAGQIGLNLVGLVNAVDFVGIGEQILRVAAHPQQEITAAQTGFVGKRADRFHDRPVNLAGPLGLNPMRLVQRGEFLQQVFGGTHHGLGAATLIGPSVLA